CAGPRAARVNSARITMAIGTYRLVKARHLLDVSRLTKGDESPFSHRHQHIIPPEWNWFTRRLVGYAIGSDCGRAAGTTH
ncbi:MAG: hypothetical protein WAQ15_03525, partial [Bacillota bacterium]